jgi:hypothetical protein
MPLVQEHGQQRANLEPDKCLKLPLDRTPTIKII